VSASGPRPSTEAMRAAEGGWGRWLAGGDGGGRGRDAAPSSVRRCRPTDPGLRTAPLRVAQELRIQIVGLGFIHVKSTDIRRTQTPESSLRWKDCTGKRGVASSVRPAAGAFGAPRGRQRARSAGGFRRCSARSAGPLPGRRACRAPFPGDGGDGRSAREEAAASAWARAAGLPVVALRLSQRNRQVKASCCSTMCSLSLPRRESRPSRPRRANPRTARDEDRADLLCAAMAFVCRAHAKWTSTPCVAPSRFRGDAFVGVKILAAPLVVHSSAAFVVPGKIQAWAFAASQI